MAEAAAASGWASDQRLEVEAFLVVAGHVEAGLPQHGADGGHVGFRAAGEDRPLRQIGGDQLEHRQVQPAPEAAPVALAVGRFADMGDGEAGQIAGHQVQFGPEDDIGGAAGAVDEGDVPVLRQIVVRPRHRHQRRDAAAA